MKKDKGDNEIQKRIIRRSWEIMEERRTEGSWCWCQWGIFRGIVHMNIHHRFSLNGSGVYGSQHWSGENGDRNEKKGSFSVRGSMCSSQNEFHLIYMRKSRQPPSLSWREKPFRKTAEINQRVGPWCSLCGLGQRWSHCNRPLALMMCSEPVEACKSAAGISFSAASILSPTSEISLSKSPLCTCVNLKCSKHHHGRLRGHTNIFYRWTETTALSCNLREVHEEVCFTVHCYCKCMFIKIQACIKSYPNPCGFWREQQQCAQQTAWCQWYTVHQP